MIVIISLLLILSFIVFAIGLIKPKIIKLKSRKKVLAYGIPILFVLFISGLISAPELTPEQKAQREKEKELAAAAELEEKEKESEQQEVDQPPEKDEQPETNKQEVKKSEPQKTESKDDSDSKGDSDSEVLSTETKNPDKPTEKEPPKKEESVIDKSQETIYEFFKFGDDEMDETIIDIEFEENEKSLSVIVKGKDGWSEKSIGAGFYEDSTAVYRELSKDKRIDEAWITITFPMKDEYGNVSDEEVMGTWMSRETMDKIDWEKFNYLDLVDVVDGNRIYPQFVQ